MVTEVLILVFPVGPCARNGLAIDSKKKEKYIFKDSLLDQWSEMRSLRLPDFSARLVGPTQTELHTRVLKTLY